MNPLHTIARHLRSLFRKETLDAEMAEEMRAHLELQAEENEKRGMSSDEARFAARREFGGVEQLKERARDERGWRWLDELAQDLRYGIRQLRKNPGFTAVVALTLALGIGVNTVVFTFYSAVVLKPLAVRDPDQMVRLITRERKGDQFAYAEFEDLQARAKSFSAVVATSTHVVMLARRAEETTPEVVAVRLVSPGYFSALGVAPALGRGLGAGDRAAGVLSYETWRRRFNADPAMLGQTLIVQNVAITIVGVAPEAFAGTGRPASAPDLWLPLALQPEVLPAVDWLHDPAQRQWQVLARRKPGVALAQAAAELDVIGRSWPQADREPLRVTAAQATLFDAGGFLEFQAVCAVLMAAVGMVLLIGGVNVVNLLAARNAAREHELAVRLALGAGRRRLVRQLCTESLLLGLLGGIGGLLFSRWACDFLRTWLGGFVQELSGGMVSVFLDVRVDWHVLVYSVVVSLFTGVLVGVWPAIRATGATLETALKQSTAAGRDTHGPWSRRNLLLTTQVAACLLLLAGAGLLFRGASHALATEPGFDAKHLFLLRLDPATSAATEAGRRAVTREVLDRIAALPEVDAVTWSDRAPYMGHSIGQIETDEGRWVNGCVNISGAENYFATLGIPIVAGRTFTPQEVETGAAVVVISESAARNLWPGKDPLGRRIVGRRTPKNRAGTGFTVVGVAKDARLTLLSQVDAVDLFYPQPLPGDGLILVHTRVAPEGAIRSTLGALRAVNATLPSQALILTMEQGPMRFQKLWASAPAVFASLVGGIALVLAAVGIYGVVSFLVARRTREIGIHLALGAQKRDVVALVLRQTLRPVVWGAGIGLAGAVGLSVLITRLVLNPEIPDLTYGAGVFPSATLVGVLALLLGVILLAAFIPARRATKVDPMVALRSE